MPGKNATGRLINKIIAQYSEAERQPRYRGNLFCIYFANKSEPVFVIGPHWQYALAMLVVTNFVVGVAVDTLKHDNWMHLPCLGALYAWDFLTVYLILINPGLSPRDPRVHTRQYLKSIEDNCQIYRLCNRCQLVQQQDGTYLHKSYFKLIEHCKFCDACVQGRDRHFQWLGKCIGGNMERYYGAYVFLSLCQVFSLIFSLLMFLGI